MDRNLLPHRVCLCISTMNKTLHFGKWKKDNFIVIWWQIKLGCILFSCFGALNKVIPLERLMFLFVADFVMNEFQLFKQFDRFSATVNYYRNVIFRLNCFPEVLKLKQPRWIENKIHKLHRAQTQDFFFKSLFSRHFTFISINFPK